MSLVSIAPALFVLIWSTGWIVAKYAAPHADPLTFLAVRFACAGLLMGAIALIARAEWPKSRAGYANALASGVLLHALYLGAVWWAIAQGLPAGISALIAALQPLMTALLAPRFLGEKPGPVQIAGIAIGFLGVAGVIAPKLATIASLEGLALPVAINVAGMLSVTLGTFYQKRYISTGDLRVVSTLQYAGAFLAILPLALMFESLRFDGSRIETWLALAWSVIPLSIGAIWLMLMLIRRGAVSRVAALIYLIPPTAAIEAWLMFGETLSPLQIAFMALTAVGVYLATRPMSSEKRTNEIKH